MRHSLLIARIYFLLIISPVFAIAQEPDQPYPDLPVPGMYSLLQKLKVKEADVWNCSDSLCNVKEMNSFFLFDQQNRIDKEMDVEDGKNVPYEIYTYPNKNEIIKKYNADEYIITHKYTLDDKGMLIKQTIEWNNNNEIEDNYFYNDTVLIKEQMVDKNATLFYDTITMNYEYGRDGRLIKKHSNTGSKSEEYTYDTGGNLSQQTIETKDVGTQRKIVKYFYSQNRLIKKTEEFYSDGKKEDSKTKETTYSYDSNGLLNEESYVAGKGNKRFHILYTYIF